jgi:cysteine desulfurase
MHVNNETGVIQPIDEIAAIATEAEVPFHCDGVQAVGKLPTGGQAPVSDFYAISGHKFHAPKGVGALYVRTGSQIESILRGGHQERDRRPGTQNVPGAVALGMAAKLARKAISTESPRLAALRDRLECGILERISDSGVNGSAERVPNTTNIYFDGIGAEAMLIALDLKGYAVATGSACSSGAVEASHVLTAMGLSRDRAKSSLRFSLGATNDADQVDGLVEAVVSAVAHLRKVSPVA